MTQLVWNAVGDRLFEAGVDRGVLFDENGFGVAWNGLTAVRERTVGGTEKPIYVDGQRVRTDVAPVEFEAGIDAYTYPKEFAKYMGDVDMGKGLAFGLQGKKPFSFSYRTRIGNDLEGVEHGYKIHLVYNALATPSDKTHSTLGRNVDPAGLSWDITTTGIKVPGFRTTAHFVIDSTKTPKGILEVLEGYLYGSDNIVSRLPHPISLYQMFDDWGNIEYPGEIDFKGLLGTGKGRIYNLVPNPNMTNSTLSQLMWENLATNPRMERVVAGTTTVRRNLHRSPGARLSGIQKERRGWWVSGEWDVNWTDGIGYRGTTAAVTTYISGSQNQGLIAGYGIGNYGIDGNAQVNAGGVYSFGIWVKPINLDISLKPVVGWRKADGSHLSYVENISSILCKANEWTLINANGMIAPAEAAFGGIRVGVTSPSNYPSSGTVLHISSQLSENLPKLSGDFFDGLTTDSSGVVYGFEGTANSSPSFAKAAVATVRTNICPNPALAVNDSNWIGGVEFERRAITDLPGFGFAYGTAGSAAAIGINTRMYMNTMPTVVGTTYTLSAMVRTTGGSVRFEAVGDGSSGTGTSFGSVIPNSNGVWQRLSITFTATETSVRPRLIFPGGNSWNPIGTVGLMTGVLLEAVGVLLPYFDGGFSPDSDMVAAWIGEVGFSASTLSGVQVFGMLYQSNLSAVTIRAWLDGKYWARVIPLGSSGSNTFAELNPAPLDSAKFYTIIATAFMAEVQSGTLSTRARDIRRLGGSEVGVGPFTNAPGTYQMRGTFSATSGGTRLLLFNGASLPHMGVWYTSLAIVEGNYFGPYFDGSSGYSDPDLTTKWVSAINGSVSQVVGPNVSRINTSARAKVVRSVDWAADTDTGAGFSARIVPVSQDGINSSESYFQLGTSVTGLTLGMEPGKTYTAIATARLKAPKTGESVWARRIVAYVLSPAGGLQTFMSEQIPNEAGVKRLSITFDVPLDAVQAYVILHNGSSSGGGDIWWDEAMLVEGIYDGGYFDGNQDNVVYRMQYLDGAWTGTPDGSTSYVEYYEELPSTGVEGDAYLVGDLLYILWNGIWRSFGNVPLPSYASYN